MRPTRSLAFLDLLSRPVWIGLGVGLLALVSTPGCKQEYPACKKDKHCNVEEGEKCVDGLCQNCVTNDECKGKGPNGEDWNCVEFRCSDAPPAGGVGGPGSEGTPCTSGIECNGGLTCTGGTCSKCTDDTQCTGGTCDLGTGLCSQPDGATGGQCTTDDECAMDEICDGGMCVFGGDYQGDGEVLCNLPAIFFAFDSPQIQPDAQEQLKTAAPCIAEQNRLVYLEAHADPRGTEEYNILLTDKRGQSVKSFLVNLGVSADNMQVISKGSLEAQGSDEAGFAKDRRVQFIWQ